MGGPSTEEGDESVEPPATTGPRRPDHLFLVLAACSLVATAGLLVVLFAWDQAPFAFTFDDAYYYFGIARNLAAGHGSTFDGINLTNGYHPLWIAVATVPYKLGLDDLVAARALLATQLVVGWGGSLLIIARIISRSVDGWARVSQRAAHEQLRARRACTITIAVMFTLVAINPFVVKVFVNGLETGLVVTLLALLLLLGTTPRKGSKSRRRRSWIGGASHSWRLGVSVVLALTFLGRTDAVFLLGCLFLWVSAEWWNEKAPFAAGAAALLELFAIPALTIVVYLLVNNAVFGTPFQVSGLVKRAALEPLTVFEFAVFVAAAGYVGFRAFRAAHRRKRRRHAAKFKHAGGFAATTGWYGAFCILVTGYYAILQTQIWLWYFAPLVLYGAILLLLAIADMCEVALRDGRQNVNPPLLLLPIQILFGVLLAAGLVIEIGVFRDPNQLSMQIADRDIGVWLRDNTDPGAVAASWDAGAVGYFSHRSVVNLDGLVNSREYYDAMRNGTVANFLRCEHIAYLANHGEPANGDDPSFRDVIRDVYGPDAATRATIVYRQPFFYDGTTTGSAGSATGLRQVMAYVYQVPPDAVAGARC